MGARGPLLWEIREEVICTYHKGSFKGSVDLKYCYYAPISVTILTHKKTESSV